MDMMDKLEVLDGSDLPDLGGSLLSGLIDGPFVVDHNGVRSIGALMSFDGDGVTFVDANHPRSIGLPSTLDIDTRRQTLTFENPLGGTKIIISPLEKGSMKEFWPGVDFADMDEFKFFIIKKALGIYGRIPAAFEYAVCVAEDDDTTVLGLYRYAPGNMQARQNGQWVTLNENSPEWDTIEEGQWVPVLSGAVQFWDENEDREKITTNDILNWIVGN